MVLGELVLRPLPVEVAHRVAQYAQALGIKDDFVRVARRYAQGAYGLAWMDLQRSGFVEHVRDAGGTDTVSSVARAGARTGRRSTRSSRPGGQRSPICRTARSDAAVWDFYDSRGFALPGAPGGAPEYLAQHDFVHVLADYGTNLRGELEVFALIGRADPDPKGFAWLATLIGLFETGYIENTGFFERDVRERNIQASGMHVRLADAIRRGKIVCEAYGDRPLRASTTTCSRHAPSSDVRELLRMPDEVSGRARRGLARGVRPRRACRRHSGVPPSSERKHDRERELHADDLVPVPRSGGASSSSPGAGTRCRPSPTSWATWARTSSPTATTRATT